MRNSTKGSICKGTAVFIDVAAPLAAVVTQFPIWVQKSAEATVSGLFLILALICSIPLLKHIKAFIRSPSIPIVWCILFVVFLVMKSIIDEMLIVCFVGVISNAMGAFVYKFGKHLQEKDAKEGE